MPFSVDRNQEVKSAVMYYSCGLTSTDGNMTLAGTIGNICGCSKSACFAIILASQAVGVSRIHNAPRCAEIFNLIVALKALGIRIYYEGKCIVVEGVGVGGFAAPSTDINAGNSIFVACSLCGILAAHPFTSFISQKGGYRASKKLHEVDRLQIIESLSVLSSMGARFTNGDGAFPILITGIEDGIPLSMENILESESAKAAILLASMNIAGESYIRTRYFLPTHMEFLLQHFGAYMRCKKVSCGTEIINCTTMKGQIELSARDVRIFPSTSYVLYLIAAVLVTSNSEVAIEGVYIDDRMMAIIDVFTKMGGQITVHPTENSVLSVIKVKSSRLCGIDIYKEELKFFWEELPILLVVCVLAEGTTRIFDVPDSGKDIGTLKVVLKVLANCGFKCAIEERAVVIHGARNSKIDGNPVVNVMGDYSIGIPFVILNLACRADIRFGGCNKQLLSNFMEILNVVLEKGDVIWGAVES